MPRKRSGVNLIGNRKAVKVVSKGATWLGLDFRTWSLGRQTGNGRDPRRGICYDLNVMQPGSEWEY